MFNFAIARAVRHATAAFLAIAALCLAQGASAAMTPWATNTGGKMRIVALPPEPDGTVRGALQIEPEKGWITYWKEPGQAGIPPQITLSPGEGITLEKIEFPVPSQFTNGGLKDLGYDHAVTLPFTLKLRDPKQPVTLNASVFVGLCRNICIPFQADFKLSLASANALPFEENLILDKARQSLPEKPSNDFAVTHYVLTGGRETLSLGLRLPDGTGDPKIFVAGPNGHVLFDQANPRSIDGHYVVDMPVGKLPRTYEPKGKRWDILVIAGNRAMETSLAFD
jgi:DsbC/DsbD-like thiol-disulfide interchange protein